MGTHPMQLRGRSACTTTECRGGGGEQRYPRGFTEVELFNCSAGQLMNFMKSVMDQGEDVKEGEDAQQDKQTPDYSQITFQDYLAERGISGDLQRFISYAIALDPGVECSAAEALRTMKVLCALHDPWSKMCVQGSGRFQGSGERSPVC